MSHRLTKIPATRIICNLDRKKTGLPYVLFMHRTIKSEQQKIEAIT